MSFLTMLEAIFKTEEQKDFTHYIKFEHQETGRVLEFQDLNEQETDDLLMGMNCAAWGIVEWYQGREVNHGMNKKECKYSRD